MPLPKAAVRPDRGCGGLTGGPYILRLSRPLTASAWSRTTSADEPEPRAAGEQAIVRDRAASSSGVTRDDCR